MALTSVKPVVSHCTVEASMPISAMIDGWAGVTTVWLSTVTKVPKIMMTSITICCRVSPYAMFPPGCPSLQAIGSARSHLILDVVRRDRRAPGAYPTLVVFLHRV